MYEELEKHKKLTNEEMLEYFEKVRAGDNKARDFLIVNNIRFVILCARKLNSNSYSFEDTIQEGLKGLIAAIDGYNPDKGFTFHTYAYRAVYNSILMFYRMNNKHMENYGKSLDAEIISSDDQKGIVPTLADIIADDTDIELEYIYKETEQELLVAIERLNDDDRMLIKSYYGIGQENVKQNELAELFDLTQSAISRKIKKILKELKMELE